MWILYNKLETLETTVLSAVNISVYSDRLLTLREIDSLLSFRNLLV